MKRILLYFLLLIWFSFWISPSMAQHLNPPAGKLFCDTLVPRIDIFIHPDTLQWLYENVESNQEFHALFIFSDGSDTDTLGDIGFRLRGNTSRYSAKKSFKVSFNTFVPGRKFEGVEKINLNGEHNDPSVIRAKLCWDLLDEFSLPGARSNHVRLFINNNYYGLYLNVEHIDEEFAMSRFGNQGGNLFKCLWPADLDYLGNNPNLYKLESNGRRAYDLKTNTAADDYTDIAHFIDVLNNSSAQNFFCETEDVLNIYAYARIAALDILTGNWDGYIYNKNNFYLYHNQTGDRFEYIPYDLDNTLGIDWLDRDWATRDIYDWEQHGDQKRPLYTRLIDDERLRDVFSFYLHRIAYRFADTGSFTARILEIRDMIKPFVQDDPYYPLDYGYSIDDFMNSYYNPLGGHVKYGLLEYMQLRMNTALQQLDLNDIFPVIYDLKYNYPQAGEEFWVTAHGEDDGTFTMQLIYLLNGGPTQTLEMADDGQHHDGEAGDGIYGAMVSDIPAFAQLEFYVSGTDNYGKTTHYPCDPVTLNITPPAGHHLFINEILAGNSSVNQDEYGEYDDWVEIYNGENTEVWMGNKYLSDNFDNPAKFKLPDVMLGPGQFLLIWTDDDANQGMYHAPFKLEINGEEIGIFDAPETGHAVIDTITFGPQQTDISFGRASDGSDQWVFFDHPTPGSSNHLNDIRFPGTQGVLNVFPNPVADGILYFSRKASFELLAPDGRMVAAGQNTEKYALPNLPAGIYILNIEGRGRSKIVIPKSIF